MIEVRLSTTLYERFLTCPKAAAFSIDEDAKKLSMPSLRAALGKVSHRLVEESTRIPHNWSESDIALWFDENWRVYVEEQFLELVSRWAPNRVLKPESWPGYFATKAAAKSLVSKSSGLLPPRSTLNESSNPAIKEDIALRLPLVEQYLVSPDLGIVGKPDFVFLENGKATIYDYKFGNNQNDVEKHKLQMYFYQLLVESVLDVEVGRLAIVSSANKVLEIPFDRTAVNRLKGDIPRVIDAIKTKKVAAMPSSSNCRFCSFKSICEPFKSSHIDLLPGRPMVISGHVTKVQRIDEKFQELMIRTSVKPESAEVKVYAVPNGHEVKVGDSVLITDNLDFKDSLIVGFSWNSRIFFNT